MFVDFNILNQLGSPSINSNTFANRPAAGQTGRLFVSTDTFEIYRDNGTTWDLIGGPGTSTITGTGTATQVAYFTSSQAIGSSANLFWDNTNTRLGIGTNIPTDTLSVTGTAYVTGDITGNRLIKIGGLSTQYLMADGSTSTLTNPVTGTGTATQVAYFTGAQTIGSSANLFWDNTAGALGINTATPGAELDVHGTGVIVQVNATGATSNAYLAFQRTGTGVWRIGDTYNGGSNFFELHNTVLTIDALEFEAATNKSTFLAQQTYASGLATGNLFTYNLTIPNGVNITQPNAVGAVNSYLNLSLGGNTTVSVGARQGLEGNSRISFTGAGTLTIAQGSTVRAFSALSSVYSFAGSAVGTVTHLAGLRICFPDNIGSAINITNNYGLLLNDQTTGTGTVTYTNRWGIYQEGASDLNYFNGNLLIKSTTNSGEALQVTGTAKVTSTLAVSGSITGTSNSNTFGTSSLGGYPIIINTGTGANSLKINGRNSAPNDEAAIEFFRFDGVTRVAFIQAATSFFAFCTSTEAMRLNSSNFLGIGTQTIGSRLQVNGGAAIGYSASTAAPANGLQVAGATNLNGTVTIADTINLVFSTGTGTKIGTATSQKLAFWNATPIVQPTTAVASAARVGGGGTTVTDTDTFGGYTIAQVVQALRNTGILA